MKSTLSPPAEAVVRKSWDEPNLKPDKSLTKKASLNVIAAVLDFTAQLIVGLVLQPLLVRGLGAELYGAWKVLARMTGYVAAAGGRPTQALKWTIANHQFSSDFEEKRRRVATAILVWMIYLPLLLVIGGLAAWFVPVFLHVPPAWMWTVRCAAAILIGRTILLGLLSIPRAVMRGENMEYKRMGLSTLMVFIGGGLMGLAVLLDTGLIGVATAYLTGTLLTSALFLKVVWRHVPWFGLAKPSWKAVRWFCGISWWLLVWQLVSRLMVTSDIILLGVLGSLEQVTAFALSKHVPELLVTAISILISAAIPGMGGIIGGGDYEKGNRLRGEFMLLAWLCFSTFGAAVVLFNQDFVTLWVGPEYADNSLTTLLILVMVFQFSLIRTDAQFIDLTLDVGKRTMLAGACAAVSLLLSGILVAYFSAGVPGLCLGFIAGRLMLNIGYPFLVGRIMQVSLAHQLRCSLRPAITTIGLLAAAMILNPWIVARGWLELFVYGGVTAAIAFIASATIGISGDQRVCLVRRAKNLRRRLATR